MVFKSASKSFKTQRRSIIKRLEEQVGKRSVRDAREIMHTTEKQEKGAIKAINNGVDKFKKRIDLKEIENLVEQGKFNEAIAMVPFEKLEDDISGLSREQKATVVAAGLVIVSQLKRIFPLLRTRGRNKDVSGISLSDTRTAQFLQSSVGNLIVQISNDTRLSVRRIVSESINIGLTPKQTSVLIRDTVGLTEKQTARVLSRRAKLFEERSRLDKKISILRDRGKGDSKSARNAIARRGQLSTAAIDRDATLFSKRLQQQRAITISRTELTRASSFAQEDIWNQAAQSGLIDPDDTLKVWVTVPDADRSEICTTLNGQKRKLNETFFVVQTGESVQGPPAHPNCRSSLALEQA